LALIDNNAPALRVVLLMDTAAGSISRRNAESKAFERPAFVFADLAQDQSGNTRLRIL
jgi:hypothetical protein